MNRIVIIKNNRQSQPVTYESQMISAQGNYTVQNERELILFSSCQNLLHDLTEENPQTVINDGENDLSSVDGVNWLTGASSKLNRNGIPQVDVTYCKGCCGEDGFTIVSPDFTDRTTWYQNFVQVENQVLSDLGDGLTFQAPEGKRHWINIGSTKLTIDHHKVLLRDGSLGDEENFLVSVTVDDVSFTSGFNIDYPNGSIIFTSSQSGKNVKASFCHNDVENCSEFLIRPWDNEKFLLEHVEIQFSKNLNFNGSKIIMEVWAGDPSYQYYGSFENNLYHWAWGEHDGMTFRAVDCGLAWTLAASSGVYVEFNGIDSVSTVVSGWNIANPDLSIMALGDDSSVLQPGGLVLVGGFGQERSVYRSVRDLINWCNNQYPPIPACGEFENDILCFPFRYLIPAEINSSEGTLIRINLQDNKEMIGEIATVTFYMIKCPL